MSVNYQKDSEAATATVNGLKAVGSEAFPLQGDG
jgi:hypothetical protein